MKYIFLLQLSFLVNLSHNLPSKFSSFKFICYLGQLIFSYCDWKADSEYKAKQS